MATTTAAPARTAPARGGQPRSPQQLPPANVGETERWASLLGGGVLALYGLTRGSLVGLGLAALGGSLLYRGATGHSPLYSALGVNTAEPRPDQTSIRAGRGVKLESSLTINRSPEELYRFWRNLENLPRFMHNLESVRSAGGNRSHWVARGPIGSRVEWDAEILTDRPNETIGWRSLPGSLVATAGSVHFTPAPGDRGTEVKVSLKYDPPGGKVGAAVAFLLGKSPEVEVREDLRRFKRLIETGEVPTTAGQPSGRGRDPWQQTAPMVLDDRLSGGLGLASIALGLGAVLAPGSLAELIGVRDHRLLMRFIGLRELACGTGIFSTRTRPAGWAWARVAGDAMDLALLGKAMACPDAHHGRLAAATLAVAGITAADLLGALRLSRTASELTATAPQGQVVGDSTAASREAIAGLK